MKYILASSSPRRKEILNMVGINPQIIKPCADETRHAEEDVESFLHRVALQKGESVRAEKYYDSVIISSDTVVFLDNEIIGKPLDRDNARGILKKLSGEKHSVMTGISLIYRDKKIYKSSKTDVFFDKISETAIEFYLDNEVYMDKAGAYAIQGLASAFIREINGCFYNVMGFPVNLFLNMLKEIPLIHPLNS